MNQTHQNAHPHPHPVPHLGIAILLAMSMALGSLSIDAYLPAFPVLVDQMQTSIHAISLSIPAYVFMMAVGQLVAGPLSDRYGRGRIMLYGLGIFALASILITQVETLEQLLLLRGLQGFGGGWIAVCVPAIVRDRLSGREAARFFSLIGLILMLAPAIAPSIGSFILLNFDWPAIFLMLFCYAMVLGVLLRLVIFRQPGPRGVDLEKMPILVRYRAVLATRPALRYMFLQTLCFSVMLLFISHSSFIYQQHFGTSPGHFALLFGANIIFMMAATITNRRLLKTVEPRAILRWSVTIQAVGVVLLILVSNYAPVLGLFVPAMMITVGAMGAISPNNMACFMEYFHQHGGTASALMGASQYAIGALLVVASAWLPESLLAIVLAQAACTVLSLLLVWGDMRQPAEPI